MDGSMGMKNPMSSEDLSIICTITILANSEAPMNYLCGDQETAQGYAIATRSGSILYQGPVLHEVRPVRDQINPEQIGRISITLRKLQQTCKLHGQGCNRINCAHNYGPSNYLYYNCHDALGSNDQRPSHTNLHTPISTLLNENTTKIKFRIHKPIHKPIIP